MKMLTLKKKLSTRYLAAVLLLVALSGCSCGSGEMPVSAQKPGEKPGLPDNQEMFGYIKKLTSFGFRRTGTPASKKAAEYIRDQFKSFGLSNVSIEKHKVHKWQALESSLSVEGSKFDCSAMPNSMRIQEFGRFDTGKNGLSAELVYIGGGSEEDYAKVDVKNKIVVCDIKFYDIEWNDFKGMSYFNSDYKKSLDGFKHENPYISKNFPSNYYRAQKNGAAGFVGVLVDYLDQNTYYNEDLSLSSEFGMHGYMKIPGLYLGKSEGARLKKILQADKTGIKANLRFAVSIEHSYAFNVVGFIPGKSKDIILVHSHHDSVYTGAVQDGSGVAAVLAMAKYFSKKKKDAMDKTLLFATMDTHFFGYAANKGFIENRRQSGEKIILDVCVEHIGKEARNVNGKLQIKQDVEPRGIIISENSKLIAITKNAVVKNGFDRFALIPTFSPIGVCTDGFYLHKSGVSVINLISPPIYIYDKDDTLDLVAVDQLNPTASVLVDVIESVDQMRTDEIVETSVILSHRIKYYWWLTGKIVEMLFG